MSDGQCRCLALTLFSPLAAQVNWRMSARPHDKRATLRDAPGGECCLVSLEREVKSVVGCSLHGVQTTWGYTFVSSSFDQLAKIACVERHC